MMMAMLVMVSMSRIRMMTSMSMMMMMMVRMSIFNGKDVMIENEDDCDSAEHFGAARKTFRASKSDMLSVTLESNL